ncbi:MAG: YebC/PmpR family DNA-binding transcriptional regulator [Bacteroidetes bacterium]|nr:YebC/PmpR family DNA-binding transcriptional regulator [Bacteroidota bacterium]
MSGHSKWSTIKRKKGAEDAKRSKIFSRIVKEIHVAVKEGGPDPDPNPRLRLAMQNAKGANMPKDNIQRAINKAGSDAENYEEVTFEGYAPYGIAVYVECLTDNNNRTVGSIRSIFTRSGGSLGTNGSLSFLFERKGVFIIQQKDMDPEEFELEIIDAGAEEIEINDGIFIITTQLDDFGAVQEKLEEMNIEAENAELQRIPNSTKRLDTELAIKVVKVIEEFEDNEDVQNVYHNLEITDEVIAAVNE